MYITIFVLPPKRVCPILMYVAVAVRRPSVAEIDHVLMAGLPIERDEVPEIVHVFEIGARVFLA